MNNITENIKNKIGRNLHLVESHPLCITKNLIYQNFQDFEIFETLRPEVSVAQNFDDLLIPINHPSRSSSDTYYLNENTVLRTHTSAHQSELLKCGCKKFLVCGDVYRRDEVDSTHYPVFHQIEGVCLCENPVSELKSKLSAMVEKIFSGAEYKFVDSYFPFTQPSFELEVMFNGKWLEVLGCGKIHEKILKSCGVEKEGYAFGLGLERLAMVLFDIPDIRYFWTEDQRFLSQFESREVKKFEPYSKYPVCFKDIAFWISEEYNPNDFYSVAREVGGDLIESIELLDTYRREERTSHCYRINYRSMDKNLTNEEVDRIQEELRYKVSNVINGELR